MKVLNICCDDYANFAHDNAVALRSVGVNCFDVKLRPHVFNYAAESKIVNEDNLKQAINSADIIQIFHSDSSLLKYCVNKGKRIFVHHTGTRYRQNPEKFNALFNPHVETSFIALGEFAGLGAKNEIYLVGSTPILSQKPLHFIFPVRIAHFPSNPDVKGTPSIAYLFEKHASNKRGLFYMSTDRVDHADQLKRIDSCDAYVEMNSSHQDGKKYGSFGITALEAASLAKIVVTNHSTLDVYEKAYNCRPPFIRIEDHGSLDNAIQYLLELTDVTIHKIKCDTFQWFVDNHSYTATGTRIKTLLNL